jgi:hypothetical protein
MLTGARGRPTISRRAGGEISRALGVSEDTGTHIFHGVLAALFYAVVRR